MRYYPVFLDLTDQLCIVLGDGKFAVEKAAGLREAGASVRVITSRDYRPGDLAGARLVVDASEDQEINRLSWKEAEDAGILINVVDRPAQCRFIAPAIVNRDPLLVAISTSGESPFLASALRARIERWLGPEWGPFVSLVGAVRRRLRKKGVPIDRQTRVYRRLANSDVLKLLRAGHASRAESAAAAIESGDGVGRVALVGAGPGDPELLTVKAREMLAGADYVLHDALIARETLALSGPETVLEDVGKRGGEPSASQDDITARLIELAREGYSVVRLKGGDPFVFGRGGEELHELQQAGVDVIVVPGISAALAAPAAAGISVTKRGVASSVAIATAQGTGSLERLAVLARAADTLVVLMARTDLAEVAAVLARALGGAHPAVVIGSATLPDQRSVTGSLDSIARLVDEAAIDAPATLVVGDVVAAQLSLTGVIA